MASNDPLQALYDGFAALLTLIAPFDRHQRQEHPELNHPNRTVLALKSGLTHRMVSAHQTLTGTLAFYHTSEKTAYQTAVAAYDTLIAQFGPPGSNTNTWTLMSTDSTPVPLFTGHDLVFDPPIPLGAIGAEKPILYLVSLPFSVRLSPSQE